MVVDPAEHVSHLGLVPDGGGRDEVQVDGGREAGLLIGQVGFTTEIIEGEEEGGMAKGGREAEPGVLEGFKGAVSLVWVSLEHLLD